MTLAEIIDVMDADHATDYADWWIKRHVVPVLRRYQRIAETADELHGWVDAALSYTDADLQSQSDSCYHGLMTAMAECRAALDAVAAAPRKRGE